MELLSPKLDIVFKRLFTSADSSDVDICLTVRNVIRYSGFERIAAMSF